MAIELSGILITVGAPIFRSVFGWLENAMDDKKISTFEWAQLGATVLRVGTISACAYIGLNSIGGVEVSAFATSASAILLDLVISKFKITK